jgi:hypothetical protein
MGKAQLDDGTHARNTAMFTAAVADHDAKADFWWGWTRHERAIRGGRQVVLLNDKEPPVPGMPGIQDLQEFSTSTWVLRSQRPAAG